MGWDIGYVSTPLQEYIDQLHEREQHILIPGAGNAYEAEYLLANGFTHVVVADISSIALRNFSSRVPHFPKEHLLHRDFFELDGQFDLILEQTFFCALAPSLRDKYVEKMWQLLKPNGKLVGLLFSIPLNEDRPPFGGNRKEYEELFSGKFHIETMEIAYNSVAPRRDNELFISLRKK